MAKHKKKRSRARKNPFSHEALYIGGGVAALALLAGVGIYLYEHGKTSVAPGTFTMTAGNDYQITITGPNPIDLSAATAGLLAAAVAAGGAFTPGASISNAASTSITLGVSCTKGCNFPLKPTGLPAGATIVIVSKGPTSQGGANQGLVAGPGGLFHGGGGGGSPIPLANGNLRAAQRYNINLVGCDISFTLPTNAHGSIVPSAQSALDAHWPGTFVVIYANQPAAATSINLVVDTHASSHPPDFSSPATLSMLIKALGEEFSPSFTGTCTSAVFAAIAGWGSPP